MGNYIAQKQQLHINVFKMQILNKPYIIWTPIIYHIFTKVSSNDFVSCNLSFSCPSDPGLSLWIHGLCSLAWPALHCGLWTDRPPREAPRLLSGHSSSPGRPSDGGSWKEKEVKVRQISKTAYLFHCVLVKFENNFLDLLWCNRAMIVSPCKAEISSFHRAFMSTPDFKDIVNVSTKRHRNVEHIIWQVSYVYKKGWHFGMHADYT